MTPAFAGNADFDKVRRGLLAMAEELKRPRQLREAGKLEDYGHFLVNECSTLRRQIAIDIATVLKSVQAESELTNQQADGSVGHARLWIILQAVLSFVVCVLIAGLNTRLLLRQLGGEPVYATEIANKIAEGDLAVDVDIK